jgi:hypothetical protein
MAAVNRLRQGVRALIAFTHEVDYALAGAYLNPRQLALFKQMKRGEQLHSLNVLRGVMAQGDVPGDLALAALLHDVGKTRYPLAIWQKSVAVIVRRFSPGRFAAWSARDPRHPWFRPFAVSVGHPRWSAELVAVTGASERALWLIAHHDDRAAAAASPLLARLQRADDVN